MESAWAIILAAGQGTRLRNATGGICKQFLDWKGRPLYWHSAMAMSNACCIEGLVFVFPPEDCECEAERIRKLAFADSLGLEWRIATGGERRQDSARSGLALVPRDCKAVLIHDAARCFVKPALIRRVCVLVGETAPAVVPAIPLTDTIRLVSADDQTLAEKVLPRARLRAMQTPQGFLAEPLRLAQTCGADVTDDASLLESMGLPVRLVEGDTDNVKITHPDDLDLLKQESWLPCSGFGYDVHRFGEGRPLKLGGIAIPGGFQVIAHSDGDVLLHSLIDALLGCACLGDIGRHFPDSDPAYNGISSAILLDRTLGLVRDARITLCGVDLAVVAQKPKLSPFADEIRRNVARLTGLPENRVNFKATTEEGLGFTGACEGIKAYALANAMRCLAPEKRYM